MGSNWTSTATLPGGDMGSGGFASFLADFHHRFPWMTPELSLHYARLYGTIAEKVVGDATSLTDLGPHYGSTLYKAEIDYLRHSEWAQSADDVLLRRTKSGIHITDAQKKAVAALF